MSSLEEWLAYQSQVHPQAIDLGLDRLKQVLDRLGWRQPRVPVITVAGLQVGYLFGSIIVIETLFNYTGMGWLTYQALLNRDIPLIQATVFVIAAVVMLANLAVDLLYMVFDPRIRLA